VTWWTVVVAGRVGITCWSVVVLLAGAIATGAALLAAGWECGFGSLAGFGLSLGFGGAGVVAVVVVGVAAAVLVVREVELEDAAPQPAAASATRHANTIARVRGWVIVCSCLRCCGDSTPRTPASAIASRRRRPAFMLATCTSVS
jgi:hypothetical protein